MKRAPSPKTAWSGVELTNDLRVKLIHGDLTPVPVNLDGIGEKTLLVRAVAKQEGSMRWHDIEAKWDGSTAEYAKVGTMPA